ncbi:MAG TPA: transporter substrate-binding domain-containing protein [Hyphomicrobiaceae bacterium]|nr:transporter substrate-binding domain-containing protein [Hyphomicrobiaceae bacterium]
MTAALVKELAPTGALRVGINLSNFLLVTGKAANGDPEGVSPDMGAEIARRLGVPVKYVSYKTPGELADAADRNEWDIGNIGAEPQRAEKIAFTTAYVEIEATYLVPAGSRLMTLAEVDRPGVTIACGARTAYGLWLERNIKQATIKWADGLDASYDLFVNEKLDVLAGLKPKLLSEVQKLPGAKILDGRFMAVQQAIGTHRRNAVAAPWLQAFVDETKASGFVAGLIAKHKVVGLSVAK